MKKGASETGHLVYLLTNTLVFTHVATGNAASILFDMACRCTKLEHQIIVTVMQNSDIKERRRD